MKVWYDSQPYAALPNDLVVRQIVLNGTRLVIPTSLKQQTLYLLHTIDSRIKKYIYWPVNPYA